MIQRVKFLPHLRRTPETSFIQALTWFHIPRVQREKFSWRNLPRSRCVSHPLTVLCVCCEYIWRIVKAGAIFLLFASGHRLFGQIDLPRVSLSSSADCLFMIFKLCDFLSFCLFFYFFFFFFISFPQGISPKVEFSTMSVIDECDMKSIRPAVSVSCVSFFIFFIPLIKWTLWQLMEFTRKCLLMLMHKFSLCAKS